MFWEKYCSLLSTLKGIRKGFVVSQQAWFLPSSVEIDLACVILTDNSGLWLWSMLPSRSEMYWMGTKVSLVPKPQAVMACMFLGHHPGLCFSGTGAVWETPFHYLYLYSPSQLTLGITQYPEPQTVRGATPLAQSPCKEPRSPYVEDLVGRDLHITRKPQTEGTAKGLWGGVWYLLVEGMILTSGQAHLKSVENSLFRWWKGIIAPYSHSFLSCCSARGCLLLTLARNLKD